MGLGHKNSRLLALALTLTFAAVFLADCRNNSPSSKSGAQNSEAACQKNSGVSDEYYAGFDNVLILLSDPGWKSREKVESAVRDLGGKITVSVSGQGLYALVPRDKETKLTALKEINIMASAPVSLGATKGLTPAQRQMLEEWNEQLTNQRPALEKTPSPLINDTKSRPVFDVRQIQIQPPMEIPGAGSTRSMFNEQKLPDISYAPTTTLSGRVAVAIFFPESDGAIDPNLDNWTQAQGDSVVAKVSAAFNWWAAKAPPAQNLSFVIQHTYAPFGGSPSACVQTSYEPISRPSTDEGLWINEIMTCLGYTSGNYLTKVDSFNTWLKTDALADQAFSIFVVNDVVDPPSNDHKFADGYFAYAYLGGPLIMMTYNNDGYGIANMNATCTHETGHIFHSLDEYNQPGYQGCACADSYNGCANNNCMNGCVDNACCIMRGGIDPYTYNCLCNCTKGQIGWGCGTCGSQGGQIDCTGAINLTSGQVYNGTNVGGASNSPGYSCVQYYMSGPEKVFHIFNGAVGTITATTSNITAVLITFILDACQSNHCQTYGWTGSTPYTTTLNNAAIGDYYIVIDGYHGQTSNFTLSVTFAQDSDRDGILDSVESDGCPSKTNPDSDSDGLCDGNTSVWNGPVKTCSKGEDLNVNGVVDTGETNPCNSDSDGDSMPDGWEVAHGLNPLVSDAGLDPDGDGITNVDEYLNGLDPQVANWGTIRVSSDPAGAKVYLDGDLAYPGRYMGLSSAPASPLAIGSLKNEKHTITIIAQDYFVYQAIVNVTLGQTYTVNPVLVYRQIEVWTAATPVMAAGHTVNIASGYSSPNLVDFDRNGTVDLFAGAGNGQVNYYANSLTSGLNLAAGVVVQAASAPLSVGQRAKPFVVDWNDDNKLDLLAGNSAGQVWLFTGNGTTNFNAGGALLLSGHTIQVPGGNAAPLVYDWDGDQKKDLLVGAGNGTVMLYLNSGTDAAPVFTSGASLLDYSGASINAGAFANPFAVDIDRDAHLDMGLAQGDGMVGGCLYSVDSSGLMCANSIITIILNDVTTTIDAGDNATLALGDVNNDRQLDGVLGNAAGTLNYYPSSHLAGDIDRSTKVDGGDLILLQQSFGLSKGMTGYNPGADLDGDGNIDVDDLNILKANFGKTY